MNTQCALEAKPIKSAANKLTIMFVTLILAALFIIKEQVGAIPIQVIILAIPDSPQEKPHGNQCQHYGNRN
jgi:hypothetical protein